MVKMLPMLISVPNVTATLLASEPGNSIGMVSRVGR